MGRSQSNFYSENQPFTPRDRTHALGLGPGEYRTFVVQISYSHGGFCLIGSEKTNRIQMAGLSWAQPSLN